MNNIKCATRKRKYKQSSRRKAHIMRLKQSILDEIDYAFIRQGFPPTMQEMAVMLNASPNTIRKYIQELINDGYLARYDGKRRAYYILKRDYKKQENNNE